LEITQIPITGTQRGPSHLKKIGHRKKKKDIYV
jgi:hypothetical protein